MSAGQRDWDCDMYDDWDYQLYCAVKLVTGHSGSRDLDAYSGMLFVRAVEKRDPQLVAALKAKIKLGIKLFIKETNYASIR